MATGVSAVLIRLLRGRAMALWDRDGQSLSRVHHRDGARPRALAGGLLVERRDAGDGHRRWRVPRIRGSRHAWRRCEHPVGGAGRGYHRGIGRGVAHSERFDIRQRHEVADRRQEHGWRWRSGHMRWPWGQGQQRRRCAHIACQLSAIGNQDRHKITVADRSAGFNGHRGRAFATPASLRHDQPIQPIQPPSAGIFNRSRTGQQGLRNFLMRAGLIARINNKYLGVIN